MKIMESAVDLDDPCAGLLPVDVDVDDAKFKSTAAALSVRKPHYEIARRSGRALEQSCRALRRPRSWCAPAAAA